MYQLHNAVTINSSPSVALNSDRRFEMKLLHICEGKLKKNNNYLHTYVHDTTVYLNDSIIYFRMILIKLKVGMIFFFC